ncbi:hypothetical protein SAMN05421831_104126 [Allopseudospirillum japonicum]|uniref:Uncharacterized protein n=1 Tax=Allopseudospirillum japonicum TaxID=64971 RepID=A0A1H6RT27_9GAMM|nr:hypothetical protein [Allopseudospirillum japonicum]SEI56614.1 hypothetical protein SAMN05421831_104126 [Allopseudospirillum japonicum]
MGQEEISYTDDDVFDDAVNDEDFASSAKETPSLACRRQIEARLEERRLQQQLQEYYDFDDDDDDDDE